MAKVLPNSLMPADGRLVWMEIETTGPDPARSAILEIAAAVTSFDLEILGDVGGLVLAQPAASVVQMDEASRKRHEASGLAAESEGSTLTVETAEEAVLALLRAHCQPGKALLAGRQVSRVRALLRHQLPAIYAVLHYRVIDLGTLGHLARRWYSFTGASPQRTTTLRASESLHEGIAELGRYRQAMFR